MEMDVSEDGIGYRAWREAREKEIREARAADEAPTGLPTRVMATPEELDEEGKEKFREARARWVVPPDGWENDLSPEMKSSMQLWDLPQLKKLTAYEFVGALCCGLGGRPQAVRAALGLQIADSEAIVMKRGWMKRYQEEMRRIDEEVGLDCPAGQYQALKWMQMNPKNPEAALKAHAKIAALHGMVVKKSAVLGKIASGLGAGVTAEDQLNAIREGAANWMNTAGRKILGKTMEDAKEELKEADKELSRYTPPGLER
jgi:hypothetical protein